LAQKISGPAPGWEQLQLGMSKELIDSETLQIAGKAHVSNNRPIRVKDPLFCEAEIEALMPQL